MQWTSLQNLNNPLESLDYLHHSQSTLSCSVHRQKMSTSEPASVGTMVWRFTNDQQSSTSFLSWKRLNPRGNSWSWGSSYKYESTNRQTREYGTWSNWPSKWYIRRCFLAGLSLIISQGLLTCLCLWSSGCCLDAPQSLANGWPLRTHHSSSRHLCRRFASGTLAKGRMLSESHENSWWWNHWSCKQQSCTVLDQVGMTWRCSFRAGWSFWRCIASPHMASTFFRYSRHQWVSRISCQYFHRYCLRHH